MFTFEYFRPSNVGEVCGLLASHGNSAKVVAGGTDLMVQIRNKDKRWAGLDSVIDISHIAELRYIKEEADWIEIGPLATHSQIDRSSIIREYASFLSEASLSVGSPQIRNMGTIGGAVCNASVSSDPVTALIALDAELELTSKNGVRNATLKSIFLKPETTNLAADELLTKIRFKKIPGEVRTSFTKLGRRKALAISRMNVAVALAFDGGKVIDARIAPGCVFAVPDRVESAEKIFIGNEPSEELIAKAGALVAEEMIARTGVRWSTEYKKPVIEALVRRTLKAAATGEGL